MTRIYDLVMTHQLDADDFFIQRVQFHAAERRLNFFLIEPLWVEAFMQNMVLGRTWARVLLNMHSEHHDPENVFSRLVRLSAEKRSRVIDDPAVASAAFDKAALHPKLIHAGIHVPPTVILSRENAAGFKLNDADREMIGLPFVIKPSMGYGRRGLVLDAASEADLARSTTAFINTHYLLQKKIVPRQWDGAPAYFRVFFAFGEVWCCWWNCFTDQFRRVSQADTEKFGLEPLDRIVRTIASLTGMNFFSSEIAVPESGEFVVIDYVNDQCHLLTQTSDPVKGVPDEVVAGIARRLVEAAHQMIREGK